MFYAHEILQKRGGRFGKIWIAATKPSTLTRREYATVNVVNTCDSLLRCITLQAQPRMSLYLSSQLMCGLVRVHKKQCDYLTKDIINFQYKVNLPISTIDLPVSKVTTDRQTLPDVSMSDPEFGLIRSAGPVIPFMIPEEDVFSAPSTTPPSTSTDSSGSATLHKGLIIPHLAPSPQSIQLRESQSPVKQSLQIPEEEVNIAAFDPGFERAVTQVQEARTLLQSPTAPGHSQLHDHVAQGEDDRLWLSEDEVFRSPNFPTIEELTAQSSSVEVLPPDVPEDIPEDTPRVETVAVPSLDVPSVERSPRAPRRGKKRRLPFADEAIQIRKEEMRRNMATSSRLCKKRDIISIKSHHKTAAELFQLPARVGMRKSRPLMDVWRRQAVPCDYQDPTRPGHPIWSIYYLHDGHSSDEDDREKFIGTEGFIPEPIATASLLGESGHLSESATGTSIQAQAESFRTGRQLTESTIEEGPTESDIPEQPIEMDPIEEESREPFDDERDGEHRPLTISQQTVLEQIIILIADGPIGFDDLCPPGNYRQVAVKVFTTCMEFATMGVIKMSQTEFYGRIQIERGPDFYRAADTVSHAV